MDRRRAALLVLLELLELLLLLLVVVVVVELIRRAAPKPGLRKMRPLSHQTSVLITPCESGLQTRSVGGSPLDSVSSSRR